MSGVLDLKTKSDNNFNGTVSLSLLSSKLYTNIPIKNSNLTIAARRTYFDLLSKISNANFPYHFYDLYGKYRINLSDKNLFEISSLYTQDSYDIFTDKEYKKLDGSKDPAWGNFLLSTKYSHFFNNENHFNINLYLSKAELNSDASAQYLVNQDGTILNSASTDSINSLFINNSIIEYGIKTTLNFQFTGQKVITGVEIKKIKLKNSWNVKENDLSGLLKYPLQEVFFDFAPNPYSSTDNLSEYSFYLLDKIQLTKKVELTPGTRTTYIRKLNYTFFTPFILINYGFDKSTKLKFSYGKYYQYLYTIKDQQHEELYAPFSSYFITSNAAEAEFSHHFTVGCELQDILPGINLNVESYYKLRKNLPSSYAIDKSIHLENGYAAGLEILIRKEHGNFNGWISYSYSRSVKSSELYTYYANYDRPNNLKFLLNFQLGDNWTISGFWIYSSGLTATPVIGRYLRGNDYQNNNFGYPPTVGYEGRAWGLIDGRKNSTRLSDFTRLDLGVTGNFLWNRLLIKPYLQILNVYNSFNPYFYSASANDKSEKEGEKRGSFVIPTIGVTVEF